MRKQEAKDYLRDMAAHIAAAAKTRENALMAKRWRDVNGLRKPDRLPVFTYPSGHIYQEIIPPDTVRCPEGVYREIELYLRDRLYKLYVGDDSVQYSFYPVHAIFNINPPNIWGVDTPVRKSGADGGAWAFDPPLIDPEDYRKLILPTYTYNRAATEEKLAMVDEVIGDILPPSLQCFDFLSSCVGAHAAMLHGLENYLVNMLAEPALMHRLSEFITQCVLRSIDGMEASGMVTPNHNGDMTYSPVSDPIGPPQSGHGYTLKNCWCISSSQELDPVSPAMWEEFSLNYQKRIFERCGLVSYGCCESLTHKMNGVMSIPNLRIFVCSAWTNLEKLVDATGGRFTIQWRQRASDIIFADQNMTGIREHLREGLRVLNGVPAQIMLREMETLNGRPDRQKAWTDLAKEAAAYI